MFVPLPYSPAIIPDFQQLLLFHFLLLTICWASWICRFIIFIRFDLFSAIKFFKGFPCLSSLLKTPVPCVLGCLRWPRGSLMLGPLVFLPVFFFFFSSVFHFGPQLSYLETTWFYRGLPRALCRPPAHTAASPPQLLPGLQPRSFRQAVSWAGFMLALWPALLTSQCLNTIVP